MSPFPCRLLGDQTAPDPISFLTPFRSPWRNKPLSDPRATGGKRSTRCRMVQPMLRRTADVATIVSFLLVIVVCCVGLFTRLKSELRIAYGPRWVVVAD